MFLTVLLYNTLIQRFNFLGDTGTGPWTGLIFLRWWWWDPLPGGTQGDQKESRRWGTPGDDKKCIIWGTPGDNK